MHVVPCARTALVGNGLADFECSCRGNRHLFTTRAGHIIFTTTTPISLSPSTSKSISSSLPFAPDNPRKKGLNPTIETACHHPWSNATDPTSQPRHETPMARLRSLPNILPALINDNTHRRPDNHPTPIRPSDRLRQQHSLLPRRNPFRHIPLNRLLLPRPIHPIQRLLPTMAIAPLAPLLHRQRCRRNRP